MIYEPKIELMWVLGCLVPVTLATLCWVRTVARKIKGRDKSEPFRGSHITKTVYPPRRKVLAVVSWLLFMLMLFFWWGSVACYNQSFPDTGNVYNVTLRFTDGTEVKIDNVVKIYEEYEGGGFFSGGINVSISLWDTFGRVHSYRTNALKQYPIKQLVRYRRTLFGREVIWDAKLEAWKTK